MRRIIEGKRSDEQAHRETDARKRRGTVDHWGTWRCKRDVQGNSGAELMSP